ncbi:Glutaredoxin-C2 [Diplonema papillatum]|nr:Glutaredoxin-C2 [Diplonema papillatum]
MAAQQARQLVPEHMRMAHVLMFSKASCPFCRIAMDVFVRHGAKPAVYDVGTEANGAAVKAALLKITGQRTVPNVFIGDRHIGGCDAVQGLDASGGLAKLLKQAASL